MSEDRREKRKIKQSFWLLFSDFDSAAFDMSSGRM